MVEQFLSLYMRKVEKIPCHGLMSGWRREDTPDAPAFRKNVRVFYGFCPIPLLLSGHLILSETFDEVALGFFPNKLTWGGDEGKVDFCCGMMNQLHQIT